MPSLQPVEQICKIKMEGFLPSGTESALVPMGLTQEHATRGVDMEEIVAPSGSARGIHGM